MIRGVLLYVEDYFLKPGPAIFQRGEKIGTEIQNCRYALFFIPQRNVPFRAVL